MRIIFLDFDGVISNIGCQSRSVFIRSENNLIMYGINIDQTFNRSSVERLARLTIAAQAKIVFSTSWRSSFSLTELSRMLHAIAPFPKECFAGITPYYEGKKRGLEIADWLKPIMLRHPELQYVILDDAPQNEFLLEQAKNLVQTNCARGLQPSDVERAMKILHSIT